MHTNDLLMNLFEQCYQMGYEARKREENVSVLVPCSKCRGSGIVEGSSYIIGGVFLGKCTCPLCKGSGKTIQTEQDCGFCNGQKEIRYTVSEDKCQGYTSTKEIIVLCKGCAGTGKAKKKKD